MVSNRTSSAQPHMMFNMRVRFQRASFIFLDLHATLVSDGRRDGQNNKQTDRHGQACKALLLLTEYGHRTCHFNILVCTIFYLKLILLHFNAELKIFKAL